MLYAENHKETSNVALTITVDAAKDNYVADYKTESSTGTINALCAAVVFAINHVERLGGDGEAVIDCIRQLAASADNVLAVARAVKEQSA